MKSLVNYSSSSSDSCEEQQDERFKSKRRKIETKRLPLPLEIKNIKTTFEEDPVDCPELHGGRVRNFKHERGNWVSYVYIPVNLRAVHNIQEQLQQLLDDDVECVDPDNIHISLTKTIVLRHHWIESFLESIREELKLFNSFLIRFSKLKVYTNEDRTRTFISLQVDSLIPNILKRLVTSFDKIVEEFRQPKFYDDPSYHASILWYVGDKELYVKKRLADLELITNQLMQVDNDSFDLNVDKIYCKTEASFSSFC